MASRDVPKKPRKTRTKTNRTGAEAPKRKKPEEILEENGGLTPMQALAVWELILRGDGRGSSGRAIKLKTSELSELESRGWVVNQPGRRKQDPKWGAKLFLTDAAWEWANQRGLGAHIGRTKTAAGILEDLLRKVRSYLNTHKLALDHLLRPRAEGAAEGAPADGEERAAAPSVEEAAAAEIGEQIRAAYLRATRGSWNEYVRLALLRAELPGLSRELVDEGLRDIQRRGEAVLYPMDDPQRIQPEDDVAALRVAGERRDLICIRR